MTPTQRLLARHALGLPNRRKRSYRNRYVAAYIPGGEFDQWSAMESAGWAERGAFRPDRTARFWLTPEGARLALEPGESLDPEDFPT